MFIEVLAGSNLKTGSVRNYVSAIATVLKWLNLPYQYCTHGKVSLMFRALDRSVTTVPVFKPIFHLDDIEKIMIACQRLPSPQLYKTLYSFAYFGFFRISNLVPTSLKSFHVSKHLCRGDIIIMPEYLVILVKWSKTLQASNQGSYIVIPKVQNSSICPYRLYLQLQCMAPAFNNAPCFLHLTEALVRLHLKKVLLFIKLDPSRYTFHTFRRSGATLAYNLGIEIEKIKRHGTWKSDSVNSYIVADPTIATGVASTLQRLI